MHQCYTGDVCAIPLTRLPLDTTAVILADDIFKCIFVNESYKITIQISLKLVPMSPTANKASTGSGNGLAPNKQQAINRGLTTSMFIISGFYSHLSTAMSITQPDVTDLSFIDIE